MRSLYLEVPSVPVGEMKRNGSAGRLCLALCSRLDFPADARWGIYGSLC